MYFSRSGFFEGPWEIFSLPGGDGYRITVAPVGDLYAPEPYPWKGEQNMASITWWCLNDCTHPADPRVVDGLLEIHRVIRPDARQVRAEVLFREYGYREYLQRVADELRYAVRSGRLHVELFPPMRVALTRDKKPEEPAKSAPSRAGPLVNPRIEVTDPIVAVKRPDTQPARKPVLLRTDATFDGKGTLSYSGGGQVKFFTAAIGGTEVPLDGTANVFPGAKLATGVTLYAEGLAPSAVMKDVRLELSLAGGTQTAGPKAVGTMSVLGVTLDICESRTTASSDPKPLSSSDKVAVGRFIHQQFGDKHGRALVIVRKVNGFTGNLVLDALDAKVRLFDAEKAGTQVVTPHKIVNGSIPVDGVKFWAEGVSVSGALRDTGFRLGIEGADPNADNVKVTVVRFSALEAVVPSTPANTSRLLNSPVPRHTFKHAATPAEKDFDVDFATNLPLVLPENAIVAGHELKFSVKVEPTGVPVRWSVGRDVRPAPDGDHPDVVAISPKVVPTITEDSSKPTTAKLMTDAVGSFHVRPYVDCNGTATFDPTIDLQPFTIMNLVLIRIQGKRNQSVAYPANSRVVPPSPTAATGVGVTTGVFSAGGPRAAVHNLATAIVIGGGNDGSRGLDRLFGGWVNNELASPGSPTSPLTEDVVAEYLDTSPPPPAPPLTHRRISIWTSVPAPGALFLPGGPTTPALVAGPLLDVTPFPAFGTGGNTCVGTEGAVGPPTPIAKIPHVMGANTIGQEWIIQMWDSPADGGTAIPAHGVFPGVLVAYRCNLDFRTDLVFWTNVTKTANPTPDAACRLYVAVQSNRWQIRFAIQFNPTTGAPIGAVPPVSVTLTKDSQPTRIAHPVAGTKLEIRHPISLRLLAIDARS